MNETIILKKLRAGDPAGLEALMDRYIPYVSAVVWHILRGHMSREDGEEVVSDVFLAAWRQAEQLEPGRVKGWLGAVARNTARNKLRQMGKTLPLEEDGLELPAGDDCYGALERDEEQQLVREALESLSPQDREIFFRHYYYAQTVGEISLAMGMNGSTVKTRLRRGREKLKGSLLKEGFVYEA